MPQPAFSVSPASCTLLRMSSIESPMVPDTVQLMVEVAGLCSSAPAFEVKRPAGVAPRRSAHKKRPLPCFTTLFMDGYLSPEVLRTAFLRPQSPNRKKGRPTPAVLAGR